MQRLRSPRPSPHCTAIGWVLGGTELYFPWKVWKVSLITRPGTGSVDHGPGPRKCECFNVGSYVIRTGAPQRPAPADGRPDHGEFGVGENIFVAPTLLPPVSALEGALEGALVGALVGLQRRHEEALVLSGAGPPPPAPARAGHLRGHGAAPLLRPSKGHCRGGLLAPLGVLAGARLGMGTRDTDTKTGDVMTASAGPSGLVYWV